VADLTVSPESLRAAGRQFGQLADRLNTEWTSFASQVQAMGDIFGDDMVGGLIGASHEGAMEVQSQPGHGTTFTLSFPGAHRAEPA